jgi:hypothetical protein
MTLGIPEDSTFDFRFFVPELVFPHDQTHMAELQFFVHLHLSTIIVGNIFVGKTLTFQLAHSSGRLRRGETKRLPATLRHFRLPLSLSRLDRGCRIGQI